jgi:signal transduction histidine kinase
VNNVLKHAQATRACIRIQRRRGELQVSVQDDGRGFAADGRRGPDDPPAGIGLSGIAERVRILGGTHVIRSLRGEGTMISVCIPIRRAASTMEASHA